ncbi:glycogen synthase GlgA [Thiohalorhabdus methylotrophus]|uniref:Glycogen synthase n=1 Tax=Thiohalorhabdus methylotrophus TaxID=3242694 RepID=A0ABV4TXM3_9GAMM
MLKILFVSSEVHPFVKTGGLGDVSASLPFALSELGHDVRILLPGYADTLRKLEAPPPVPGWNGARLDGATDLLEARLPDSTVPVWLLDAPGFSDRPGNPYVGPDGAPHPDNARRFDRLARAAAAIAGDRAGLGWMPDVIHCNDWQTGLVPVRMLLNRVPVAVVFTVHNIAYQGLFPFATFQELGLPPWLWHPDALEFYDHLSFMKGGAVFADRLTTVSPTYAREIQTPAHGWGLEGLFSHRAAELTGILNGIDHRQWDPETDRFLPAHYSSQDLSGKRTVKEALQAELDLDPEPDTPLLGVVSRLADQKGIDLILGASHELLAQGTQLAVVGTGDRYYETTLRRLAEYHPGRVGLHLGFSEALAHRLEAGADMLLMPSRFEPCGLNQLYGLRYGTVPVVRAVGGLADSVVDADSENLAAGRATGITFLDDTPAALAGAVRRALTLYETPDRWRRIQVTGMGQDFTWERSAARYVEIYRSALEASEG